MSAPTLRQLQRLFGSVGVTVWDDKDCGCYRAEAPAGHKIDDDLHEYVAVYSKNAEDKRDARRDLYDRFDDVEVQPCEGPCCFCRREQ